jgi:hypothetical protein
LTRYSLLVTLDVLDAVKEEIVSTTASSKGLEYETSPLKLTMNGHLIEIDLSAPQAAPVRDALRTYVAASARDIGIATGPAESAVAPSTDDWVEEVGARLGSGLHRLVEIDPAIAATDPAELADRLVASVPTRHDLDRLTGPFYDTSGLTKWLGVTRQALDDRTKKGTLLMCPLADGTRVYPAWQFRTDRTTVPHLAEALKILRAGASSAWTVATWLRTPIGEFGDVDAVTLLDRGGDAEVVLAVARADADRWSR